MKYNNRLKGYLIIMALFINGIYREYCGVTSKLVQ